MKLKTAMKAGFIAGATSAEFGLGKKLRTEINENNLKVRYIDGDITIFFNEFDKTFQVKVNDPVIGFYLKGPVKFTVTKLAGLFKAISKAYNTSYEQIEAVAKEA